MELTAAESHIIISLHRIVTDLDRRTKAVCQKNGLTLGQFMVLEVLYHKGTMTVGEVKESILSTDGTIPVIVRNMEREGLLTRTQDEEDRRKYILELTEKGKELISRVYPQNVEMLRNALDVWTPEEQMELRKLLYIYRSRKL